MKRWKIAGISMLALIVGLTACDDKDDPAESEGTLQGSWVFQSSTFDGVKEDYEHECPTKKDYLEFKAGGELKLVYYEGDCSEDVEAGTYTIADNKVTLRSEDIGTETYTFKISGNTMTWEKPEEVSTLVRK